MNKPEINCLVSGQDTDGNIAIFEEVVPPGFGPPRHIHREQDEVFHVMSGKFRFEVDGKVIEREAGGAAFVPAGAVHAFRNIGEEPGTIHFEMIPALNVEEGFQRLYDEEVPHMADFLNQYGMDLAGPPLEA